MKPKLTPYLNFDGDCREAMEFYQKVLGGKLSMQTFREAGMETPEGYDDKIVHAFLDNENLSFMASDCMPGQEIKFGDNMHMSVVGSDEGLLRGFFEKLADGGKVEMALEKQFWGDTFGSFRDKFGVGWMINISSEKQVG